MSFKERLKITKRGYGILHRYCPGLIGAKVTCAVVEELLPFVTIFFSARIINEAAGEARWRMLIIYVVLTVLIGFIFSMTANSLNKVVEEKESRMWNYFPKIFSDKQMRMDYADLENKSIQKQKQKAEENLFMFGNGLAQLVWDTTGMVRAIVGIAASVSLTVSLFTSRSGNEVMDSLLWIPVGIVIVFLSGMLNARLRKKEETVFEKWTEGTVWFNRTFMFYGHTLYDELARAKDVRLYRQDRIADREMVKLGEHNNSDNALLGKMSTYPGILSFIQGLCNALCYIFVVAKAYMGAFAVGNTVQYAGALIRLVRNFGELVMADSENRVYTVHLSGLFEYLDINENKHFGKLGIDKNVFGCEDAGKCCIEFRNVSFRYPGSSEYALKNINTGLYTGKKQALVGANGAGKTTFVKLLCGLYEPDEGQILLNGTDIREYDREEYMGIMACVFQDFRLFSLELGQNIAASAEYDADRVEDCIKKVSMEERYRAMPAGAGTYLYKDLSEEGVMISGGEAQKIALARALYKDTPFIILDEPTAALDPIAEAQVYEDFGNIIGNRTAVYVSHRLSSCRFCDEIMVFDKGSIVRRGTHEELIREKDGKYYELWNAQAQYYQNAETE